MDDTTNELLRQLIEGQSAQTQLPKKHLFRLRFYLLILLLLMTLTAFGVAFTVFQFSNHLYQGTVAVVQPARQGNFTMTFTPITPTTNKPANPSQFPDPDENNEPAR